MFFLSFSIHRLSFVFFFLFFLFLLNFFKKIFGTLLFTSLSQRSDKRHIARATLEAVCFQTREVLEAMNMDCGIPLSTLKVDGGMTNNNLLMQLQADLLGIDVGELGEKLRYGSVDVVGRISVALAVCAYVKILTSSSYFPFFSAKSAPQKYRDDQLWSGACGRSSARCRCVQHQKHEEQPKRATLFGQGFGRW